MDLHCIECGQCHWTLHSTSLSLYADPLQNLSTTHFWISIGPLHFFQGFNKCPFNVHGTGIGLLLCIVSEDACMLFS